MRLLHTADLHLGQILYHQYQREDEHEHFFSQLKKWVTEYKPDALLISGDIFDVPRPAAYVWKSFTKYFVDIHNLCPGMAIVMVAGNHDSPSALQSHSEIWRLANTYIIGKQPPLVEKSENWEENFIVRIGCGYIIAVPYMGSDRMNVYDSLTSYVERENDGNLPVVVMGHLAITGSDFTGHSDQIGHLTGIDVNLLGKNFDYMALGHIHRPQTIGYFQDNQMEDVEYEAPVIRYSGSALHVSCDEAFPHSVSLVDIEPENHTIKIKQLHIDQLRHFYTLPEEKNKSFLSEKEIFQNLKLFTKTHTTGYIRLKVDYKVNLSSDFTHQIYSILESDGMDLRFNPKIIWTGREEENTSGKEGEAEMTMEEIQQIVNPLDFVLSSIDSYPTLSKEEVENAFKEIEIYLRNQDENS